MGELAECYADIRTVIGTAVVPLIYRHIATLPGCLDWCWQTLRPCYLSGALPAAAERLMNRISLPPLRPFSHPQLKAAGINAATAKTMGRVLDIYNRSNPMNLVGLRALRVILSENISPPGAPAAQRPTPSAQMDTFPPVPEQVPPMLTAAQMDAATLALIHELSNIGVESRGASLPSVYRQLAHWPGFFPLAITLLESLEASGWLAATVAALRKDVGREVAQLAAHLPWTALPMPQGTPRKSLEAIIERFTATGLMRMLRIGLERTLDRPEVAAFMARVEALRGATPRSQRAATMRAAIRDAAFEATLRLPAWFLRDEQPPQP